MESLNQEVVANGITMSEQCAKEWQSHIDYYAQKKLDTQSAREIASFLLNGLGYEITDAKKSQIEKVVKVIASEMNVKLNKIRFINDKDTIIAGAYMRDDHSLVLNLAKIESEAKLLTIVAHELRHAKQHELKNNPDNEFSARLKFAFNYYVAPEGKVIKQALYKANLLEVDAELVSYTFVDNILNQVQDYVNYNTNDKVESIIGLQTIQKVRSDYQQAYDDFKEALVLSKVAIQQSSQTKKDIQESILSHTQKLFSGLNRDNSQISTEESLEVVQKIHELIYGEIKEELVEFTGADLHEIKKKVFEDANSYDILKHLDDPVIQYIEKLEENLDGDTLNYDRMYIHQIRSRVIEPAEKVLKSNNIPYVEGDYTSIMDAYFENYRDLVVQGLLSGNEQKISLDFGYTSRLLKDLKGACDEMQDTSYFLDKVPMEVLQTRVDDFITNKTYSVAPSIIPDYTEACQNKDKFRKFFNRTGIAEEEYCTWEITQGVEVMKKLAPKYFIQHMFDDNFKTGEDEFVNFCIKFGGISAENLNKELLKHPVLMLKLKAMSKTKPEDYPDMLKQLYYNDCDVGQILNPKRKKNKETLSQ